MARNVEWKLVVDETGAVKKMEMTGKEAENLDKKFDKTKKESRSLSSEIKNLGSSFGGLKGMIGMGLSALGAGGLAFGLKDIISKTNELATETHSFSKLSGIGAQSSLYYSAALKAHGLSGETASRAFGFLGKNLQTAERQQYMFAASQNKAAATGKQYTGLLGIQASAFQQLLGKGGLAGFASSTEQQKLEKITNAFEGMAGGVKKAALEKEIFGKGGTSLAGVLGGGELGLKSTLKMVKEFFPVLQGGAKGMEEYQAQSMKSKIAMEGFEFTLGTKLMPVLTEVNKWFTEQFASIEHGRGIWGSLDSTIGKGVHVFEEVYEWVGKNKWAVDALGYSLTGLGVLWGTSKVLDFVGAIKKLSLVSGISNLLGMGGAGAAAGGAGAAEAGAAGGASMLGPYVILAAATIFAAHELHLFGENLGETKAMDEGKKKASPKQVEELRARYYLSHPYAAATRGVTGLSQSNQQWLVAQFKQRAAHPGAYFNQKGEATGGAESQIAAAVIEHHTHLYLDGRQLTEAIERYSLKRAARR